MTQWQSSRISGSNSPELADFSVDAQIEYGLAGNGPDNTVGNMEGYRIQELLDDMRAAAGGDVDVPADLAASDLFTNEFIDESIGFP